MMRGLETIFALRSSIIDAWFVGTMIGKSGISQAHLFSLRNTLTLPLSSTLGLCLLSFALLLGFVLADLRGLLVWQSVKQLGSFTRARLRVLQPHPWRSGRIGELRAFGLQLFRYMTVGGLTTLLDFLLLNVLLVFVPTTQTFQINLYSTATYITSLVIGYAWHRWWTFRSSERPKAAFGRFIVLNGVTFGINTAAMLGLMAVLPSLLGLELALAANFSKALATLFSGTLNFLGQRHWVFRAVNRRQIAGAGR